MLDWLLFGKGNQEAMLEPQQQDHGSPADSRGDDELPAWLCPNDTRRDWDVLGEGPSQRDACTDAGQTELPAWRQTEAQLDELLSASFWELERDGQRDRNLSEGTDDADADADADAGQSRRAANRSQRGPS